MKKFTLLFLACLFIFSFSNAQINKGSVLLGGGISLATNTYKSSSNESKTKSIWILPSIGLAIKENTILGFRGQYGHSKTNSSPSESLQKDDSYGFGVFLRKYMVLGKNFYLFGEGGAGYNNREYHQSAAPDSRQVVKTNSYSINLYPGIAHAVSKKIHLEASINNRVNLAYSSDTYENLTGSSASTSTSKGFSFTTNVSNSVPLTLGFRFVIGK